jgi:hypothetical protein
MKLYLDDLRTPLSSEWSVVRNFDEFVEFIENNDLKNIEVISFDHDLGESAISEYFNNTKDSYEIDYSNIEEKTGYDCVKWLIDYIIVNDKFDSVPKMRVHSANPIGAANILGYVNNFYKNFKIKDLCIQWRVPFQILENEN